MNFWLVSVLHKSSQEYWWYRISASSPLPAPSCTGLREADPFAACHRSSEIGDKAPRDSSLCGCILNRSFQAKVDLDHWVRLPHLSWMNEPDSGCKDDYLKKYYYHQNLQPLYWCRIPKHFSAPSFILNCISSSRLGSHCVLLLTRGQNTCSLYLIPHHLILWMTAGSNLLHL